MVLLVIPFVAIVHNIIIIVVIIIVIITFIFCLVAALLLLMIQIRHTPSQFTDDPSG